MQLLSAEVAPFRPTPATRTLRPIELLLRDLRSRSVRYCHWKGNSNLGKALSGEKDLDLLVDTADATDVVAALAAAGFRRAVEPAGAGFPGVEHHLARAEPEGMLAHLHLHWQLIPTKGNPTLVRLPWEQVVLSTRVQHELYDVDVPAPEMELLLFLVRAALRVRTKHLLAERAGRSFLDADALGELQWLAARTTPEALGARASALIGERAAATVAELMRGAPSAKSLRALRSQMLPPASLYQGTGRRETMRSLVRGRKAAKRTLSTGGRVIAFLGSDGAGKSTVVAAVTAWLGAELDVRRIYLGSGDGATSLLRRSLRTFDSVRRSLMGGRAGRRGPAAEEMPSSYLSGSSYVAGVDFGPRALWKTASKLALAREKRGRLKDAWRARTHGAVVICDRYPQTQQLGFNDGPLLSPWLAHRSRFLRSAARRELAVYRDAAALAPDLVVKLLVSPEVAASRKDDMSLDMLRARAAAIRALSFPDATRVVEIDADQPLELVLAATRRAIWEAL